VVRRSVSRQISPIANRFARCLTRWRSPTEVLTPSASRRVSSSRATLPGTSPTTNGQSPSISTSPEATLLATRPRRFGRNKACAASWSSRVAQMPWSPRKAAWPTTLPRRRRIIWCASWPLSLPLWCASMGWPRRQLSRVVPCSRATALSVHLPSTKSPTRTTRRPNHS
jgi:hypothetical protein